MSIGSLPDNFEVVVAPHPGTGESVVATLLIGDAVDPPGALSYQVNVGVTSPLLGQAMMSAGQPLRSIDINGQPGWIFDAPEAERSISWQVNESTNA